MSKLLTGKSSGQAQIPDYGFNLFDFRRAVQPAGIAQILVTKRLDAKADPIDAEPSVMLDLFLVERSGICFNGDFARTPRQRANETLKKAGIDDRWRASPEENRIRTLGESGELNLTYQAANVRFVCFGRQNGYRECAVVTALLTEGDVNVDAEIHMQ